MKKQDLQKLLNDNKEGKGRYFFYDVVRTWLEKQPDEETEEDPKTRTLTQNKALWKFFEKVSDALTAKGVTMRKIFEKTEHFDIPPTKNNVHDLWIYFQKIMYKTDSTRDLKKLEEIENVHKVVMKNLGEMFEIEYIDFPSDKLKTKENLSGVRLAQHAKAQEDEYPELTSKNAADQF